MKLELYLQNSNTGKVYDIANIAEQIQVTSSIEGEARKINLYITKRPK